MLSKNPSKIILTEDKDFGEWVFAHHQEGLSVILLRYHYKETEQIGKILVDLITANGQQLFGRFTTVTTQKVRTRLV